MVRQNSYDYGDLYKLWWLIFQTRHVLMLCSDQELSPYGISNIQAATLFVIDSIGPRATPSEIARWLFREPHTVSVVLGRMKNKGLLTMSKDLEKRNQIRVTLTEEGKELRRRISRRKSIGRILGTLTDSECAQLWSSLDKLRMRGLKTLGIGHPPPFPVRPEVI